MNNHTCDMRIKALLIIPLLAVCVMLPACGDNPPAVSGTSETTLSPDEEAWRAEARENARKRGEFKESERGFTIWLDFGDRNWDYYLTDGEIHKEPVPMY